MDQNSAKKLSKWLASMELVRIPLERLSDPSHPLLVLGYHLLALEDSRPVLHPQALTPIRTLDKVRFALAAQDVFRLLLFSPEEWLKFLLMLLESALTSL
jgi:hypothetical protein